MISRIFLILWGLAGLFVLVFTLYAYSPGPNSDIGGLFLWCMLALTFPMGLGVAGLSAALVSILESNGSSLLEAIPPAVGIVLVWVGFCAVGYYQWFKLIPWLWKKFRP